MNLIDMRTAPPRHLWKTWQPRTQTQRIGGGPRCN